MKKFLLIAGISVFSTNAFSQSVVKDPVGVKQKNVTKSKTLSNPIVSGHVEALQSSTMAHKNTTTKAKPPVMARKPVKTSKIVKQ